ncbi:amidohydrolase [Saccharopolyspora erythraea]|uniref:amidohydrolase n=1 Tax=Saccharopolyspora erythraea TaxID=1836 RepID=UPI001BA8BF3F|nr:amidohydrolase [Saccharopolyspora erythraea]QUH03050.1 amidohydrolase [Saccharopolyspora erythraea]
MLDLLLRNGVVRTMDDRRPRASAVGVLAGRVAGLDEEVAGVPARTVVDCDGAVLLPGFGDAHNHMAWYGMALSEVDLTGCATLEEVHAAVARRAAGLDHDGWVVGSGYDDTVLGAHPHRAELDRAGGGRPVWLKHRSGHMCSVSSEVLRRAGVLDGTAEVPEGGVVARDAAGSPTGLVEEQAQQLVNALVTPVPVHELADAVARAARNYVAEGLTHVVEAGIGGGFIGRSPVELAAYQLARERGELPLRVQLMVASDALHPLAGHRDDDVRVGLDLGIRTGFGDDHLRIGPMKIFLDGSMVGRTAALTEPFCDHAHGSGYFQSDPAAMRSLVVDAHRSGWRVAAHAIGDSAVDVAIEAFAAAQREHPRPGVRHRVEHAGLVRPDQITALAELGLVPVPQARFLHEIGDTMFDAVGPDRAPWLYRHRSFLDAGLRVPGSSDRPVAAGAPLLGVQSMVERTSRTGRLLGEHERVTAEQALRAYTTEAAWASCEESDRGRLAAGLHADLVVLGADPLGVPASRIGSVPVVATFVAGRCAHGADWVESRTTGASPQPGPSPATSSGAAR